MGVFLLRIFPRAAATGYVQHPGIYPIPPAGGFAVINQSVSCSRIIQEQARRLNHRAVIVRVEGRLACGISAVSG